MKVIKRDTPEVRRRPWIAAIAAATMLVSACSGGGTSMDAVTPGDLIDSLPKANGEIESLKWNLPGEPDTLDPANAVTLSSGTVMRTICDSLTTVNPDFTSRPNLATVEVKSPTQIVYTISGDAKFWNGNPVTAADVAWNLRRAMDPAFVLSFAFINVGSIEVTGPNEVTVNFTQPDELFVSEMQILGIMEEATAEKASDTLGTSAGGIMCSGAYELTNWAPGNSITVTRNDNYWNSALVPNAKTIKFSFVNDSTALAQALNAGEIDGSYQIPSTAIPALSNSSNGILTFGTSSESIGLFIARPDGPLADNKVRQALQRSLDRDSIAKVVFNGAALPNYTYVSPGTWPAGQKETYQAAYEQFKTQRSFDIDAAKKLVEESSYDGTAIVIGYKAGDESTSQVSQLIQQQAKIAGVNVELQAMQPLVFDQAGYDASQRVGIDILVQNSFNAVPDPLEPLGFTYLPGQPYNYTNYDEPEVTDLLTQARQTFDADKRAELVVQAQTILEQASSMIPVVSLNTTTFLNNKYTGAVTSFAYWSSPALALVGSK